MTAKGHLGIWGVMEMHYICIVVVVTWVYTLVKFHLTVHLEWVCFIIYKLYLDNADIKIV